MISNNARTRLFKSRDGRVITKTPVVTFNDLYFFRPTAGDVVAGSFVNGALQLNTGFSNQTMPDSVNQIFLNPDATTDPLYQDSLNRLTYDARRDRFYLLDVGSGVGNIRVIAIERTTGSRSILATDLLPGAAQPLVVREQILYDFFYDRILIFGQASTIIRVNPVTGEKTSTNTGLGATDAAIVDPLTGRIFFSLAPPNLGFVYELDSLGLSDRNQFFINFDYIKTRALGIDTFRNQLIICKDGGSGAELPGFVFVDIATGAIAARIDDNIATSTNHIVVVSQSIAIVVTPNFIYEINLDDREINFLASTGNEPFYGVARVEPQVAQPQPFPAVMAFSAAYSDDEFGTLANSYQYEGPINSGASGGYWACGNQDIKASFRSFYAEFEILDLAPDVADFRPTCSVGFIAYNQFRDDDGLLAFNNAASNISGGPFSSSDQNDPDILGNAGGNVHMSLQRTGSGLPHQKNAEFIGQNIIFPDTDTSLFNCADGDIFQLYIDFDTGQMTFGKNNVRDGGGAFPGTANASLSALTNIFRLYVCAYVKVSTVPAASGQVTGIRLRGNTQFPYAYPEHAVLNVPRI